MAQILGCYGMNDFPPRQRVYRVGLVSPAMRQLRDTAIVRCSVEVAAKSFSDGERANGHCGYRCEDVELVDGQ
jgi:hypothetical protein